jgi:hypothetical protein
MRTLLSSCLVLLALTSVAGAASEENPATTLYIYPSHPVAGAKVYYRLVFRNTFADAIEVPADLLERVALKGMHDVGREQNAHATPAAPAAGTISWIRLEPAEEITRTGEIGELIPDCQKGCPAGKHHLEVSLVPPPSLEPIAAPRLFPDDTTYADFEVERLTIPVSHPRAFTIDVAAKRDKGKVNLKVTLKNKLRHAVWVPKAGNFFFDCSARWVVGGKEGNSEMRTGTGGQQPYATKEATLVKAGGSVTLQGSCSEFEPPKAGDLFVKLHLNAFNEIAGVAAGEPPFYLAGTLVAAEVKVK